MKDPNYDPSAPNEVRFWRELEADRRRREAFEDALAAAPSRQVRRRMQQKGLQ